MPTSAALKRKLFQEWDAILLVSKKILGNLGERRITKVTALLLQSLKSPSYLVSQKEGVHKFNIWVFGSVHSGEGKLSDFVGGIHEPIQCAAIMASTTESIINHMDILHDGSANAYECQRECPNWKEPLRQ